MTAIILALASLLCASFKDLCFKLFAGEQQKNGSYIAVIGLTWFFACAVGSCYTQGSFNAAAWIWGIAVGLSGGLSNILLAKAMAQCPAAVCSTMYRLNLVPAAILMIFLFDEPSNLLTWFGIGIAALAVLFFSDFKINNINSAMLVLVLAMLLRALMGLSMKAGSFYGAATTPCMCVAGGTWFLCGIAWDRQFIIDRRTLGFGIISGVLVIGVACFLYLALSMGHGAIIIPLSQLSFALTAILAWAIMKEGINLRQGTAIACSIIAIVLLGVSG